ncbi:uncharacterized protein A4U43_C09F5390 [Asparagus officinalis]|uniref:Uncharacterized protein n=1 Tax=Asparagus officinalis TaxID=4686 RepID=A0A5P1E5R1_ASPOF|nr:uncharacterized protein A4U43_C09F5390 [Asparagus officinalis]
MNVKCTGGGGGGSEREDGYIFQSPSNANGISSRKRIKLQKVSSDCYPVDPTLVPRRVRSGNVDALTFSQRLLVYLNALESKLSDANVEPSNQDTTSLMLNKTAGSLDEETQD